MATSGSETSFIAALFLYLNLSGGREPGGEVGRRPGAEEAGPPPQEHQLVQRALGLLGLVQVLHREQQPGGGEWLTQAGREIMERKHNQKHNQDLIISCDNNNEPLSQLEFPLSPCLGSELPVGLCVCACVCEEPSTVLGVAPPSPRQLVYHPGCRISGDGVKFLKSQRRIFKMIV